MYSIENEYSFWNLLNITFNNVFNWLVWALDDGISNLNLKIMYEFVHKLNQCIICYDE